MAPTSPSLYGRWLSFLGHCAVSSISPGLRLTSLSTVCTQEYGFPSATAWARKPEGSSRCWSPPSTSLETGSVFVTIGLQDFVDPSVCLPSCCKSAEITDLHSAQFYMGSEVGALSCLCGKYFSHEAICLTFSQFNESGSLPLLSPFPRPSVPPSLLPSLPLYVFSILLLIYMNTHIHVCI